MNPNGMPHHRTILAAAAALLLALGAAFGDVYDDLVKYDWTQGRRVLASIEAEIREAATPDSRRAIEARLLKALTRPEATFPCKQFVCRMLRRVGTAACVQPVAKLLPDEKLSHFARLALQRLATPEATDALVEALGKTDGKLKLGIVASLGERRDPKAAPALVKLRATNDRELLRAAIAALGRMASPEAADALGSLVVADALSDEWADAVLLCADQMLADGKTAAAARIYRKLFAADKPKAVRIAALRGIVLAEKEKAAGTLLALMRGKDVELGRAASKFVVEMPGGSATRALAAELASLPPEGQLLLLDALTERHDPAAAPAVAKLLGSKDEAVRIAAIRALGVIGDAASVEPLARAAAAAGAVGQAATDSLNRLKGEGVADAMGKLLDSPDPALRGGILGVLATRADKSMAPVMLKAARDKDEGVRKAAIKGLAVVCGHKELPELVALLLAAKTSSERTGLEKALSSAGQRSDDADARTAPIIAGLARADAAAKICLLSTLGKLGGEKALAAVRAQLDAKDGDVATVAVRALQGWPDATPAPDLLNIIQTTRNNIHKVLAFRGYIRMANMPGVRPAAETAAMYKQALALATTVAEKKSVLSGLANARSADALKLIEGLLTNDAL